MNLLDVHNLLNFIWGETLRINEELARKLKPLGFKVEPVEEVFNAYIYLDGEWREMLYPHPAFEIKPGGEVGATLQGFYFVFGILKEKITEEFVEEFIQKFKKSYIYGSENFLEDFYNYQHPKEPDRVFEEIKGSEEELINFEVGELTVKELERYLFDFIELVKKYRLFDL
ncbi:DUF3201 domain-containing protein [Thermococcus paralvinellae]|uniref:DUF3201 domain-containing protein n=1 Tax=Thermococcus paralvinellae TaxID=582419 RepID=W0I4X8_9EURY|nr:DUF3201 domain-containing protein [Thermococcus paralvinellae]AHF81171.1 Hypothetical protein TES1_1796 [Thermococcus paralvinellae]